MDMISKGLVGSLIQFLYTFDGKCLQEAFRCIDSNYDVISASVP